MAWPEGEGMDKTDIAIIALLQADGRMSLAKIGISVRLSISAVNDRLRGLRARKAPGIDELPSELLRALSDEGVRVLLALVNATWRDGVVPKEWVVAEIIPIPKPGKDLSKASSWRPISLTSCMAKTR